MKQSDFVRFREVLAGMSELYQRELSNPLLDVYWMALKTWSLEDFQSAASHLMATATFMPRPSDFTSLKRSGEPTAGEAWAQVIEYVSNRSKVIPNGRIERAVKSVGGFYAIGHANIETSLPHIERRFKESYEELCDVEETRNQLPQIALHYKSNKVIDLCIKQMVIK